MKKYILLSIILAASLASHAQGFEWVSTYTGAEASNTDDPTNRIIGSCVDASGNIYILGEFSPQAFLCGERLLPMEVITTPLRRAIVIAKLSPSGDLLWHKAIYNGKESCYAHALRMVGDSSIIAMVRFYLPYSSTASYYRNLYYLDTLLTGNDDYLMPTDSVSGTNYTAFITFDFDGNATERHLVSVGYLDSNGNALTDRTIFGNVYPDKLTAKPLSSESFNIDSEGNIYIIRKANDIATGPRDSWRMDDGTISALKIVDNGTHNLFYPIPYRTSLWNYQIMKFSPHFDSMIDAVYLFDSALSYSTPSSTGKIYSFEMDAQHNLYLIMYWSGLPGHIGIANSNLLHLGDSSYAASWMIKYNSDLFAENLAQLRFESSNLDQADPSLGIGGVCVDDNNNTIFLNCSVEWSFYGQVNGIFYRDNNLDLVKRSNFWLRLNRDDLSLLSVGRLLPDTVSSRNWLGVLSVNNNRVFAQSVISGTVFGDTVLHPPHYSFGILGWDYNGHEIMVKTHDCESNKNLGTQMHIRDSILYLTGVLYENFIWDTIETHNTGPSQAFIAKYVDPAFARPYVHPSDRQEQFITWNQELSFSLTDSPILLTANATSGLPVVYSCGDSSIAYSDGSTLYLLRNGTTTVTASQQGNSDYLPAEPVTKTLLVNDVGTVALANSSPQIFPNPTSGMVTIDLAKTPPATPLPPKQPRRGDTSDINMVLYTSPGAPFSQTESANFPYHQRYNMKVSGPKLQSHDGIVTAWLTDMQGRREEVVLTPTGPDRYTLDLTSRPPAAYLLTVTTADGRELTFRLMKQYGRK